MNVLPSADALSTHWAFFCHQTGRSVSKSMRPREISGFGIEFRGAFERKVLGELWKVKSNSWDISPSSAAQSGGD